MQQTVLDIQRLEVARFDPKTITATLSIAYTHNGVAKRMERAFALEDAEGIAAAIIRDVKNEGKIDRVESDDLLGSLFVVSVPREEEIEERLVMRLAKLCEKARMLKHLRNHAEYMKLFDEIKIVKCTV